MLRRSSAPLRAQHTPRQRTVATPTPRQRAPALRLAAAAAPAAGDGPASSKVPPSGASPSPQLVAAAQQLARASVQHLQLELLAPCNQAVTELVRMAEAAEEGRDVLQVLHTDFQLILEQLVAMEAGAARQESQTRITTTQWAWDHAERGQFEYWVAPEPATAGGAGGVGSAANGGGISGAGGNSSATSSQHGAKRCRQALSAEFVRLVLEAFLMGEEGVPIPDAYFIPAEPRKRGSEQEGQQQAAPDATAAASAASTASPPAPPRYREPIGLGSFVTAAPHFRELTHAIHGPLREGRYGVVVKTDHTSMPFKVRDLLSGREWWYEIGAVLAVTKAEMGSDKGITHGATLWLSAAAVSAPAPNLLSQAQGTDTRTGAGAGAAPPTASSLVTAAAAAACKPSTLAEGGGPQVSPSISGGSDQEREAFRNALARQLHMLAGIKPRIMDQGARQKGAQYWVFRQ